MEQTKLSGWTRVGFIILGILYAVTGLYMFMYPGINQYTLGWVLGITLIVYGIFKIISFFTSGSYKSLFRFELIVGVLMVIFGIIMITNVYGGMKFLGILTGIALLVDAGLRIYGSFVVKDAGVKYWWLILVLAIITGICACFFLFNPDQSGMLLTALVGAAFMSEGFMNLFIGIFAL